MKASDVSLILTTTEGNFTVQEVPGLYVEIQSHRAGLERSMNRQVSFQDALHSWMENIYQPIMTEVLDNLRIRLCSLGKKPSEVYFEIYSLAEETDFKSIDKAVSAYIEEHEPTVFEILSHLFHRSRHTRKLEVEAI